MSKWEMIEYTFLKFPNLFIFHYLDKRITGANITENTINNFDVDFNDIFFWYSYIMKFILNL